jgi:hypothetical protein
MAEQRCLQSPPGVKIGNLEPVLMVGEGLYFGEIVPMLLTIRLAVVH